MSIKKIISTVAICFTAIPLFAQQKDTAALFKEFVTICNAYKQMPLQLHMEYKKTSNLPVAEEDTTGFTAHFYIQKEGAYINFGDLEQLVNDSSVLMIMHSIKQMILTQNSSSIVSQLKTIAGPAIPDSTINKFREEYNIEKSGNGLIQIKFKHKVPGTQSAFQEIIMQYDVLSGMPQKIETISRSLIPIGTDTEVSNQWQVITIAGKGSFVLKEDNASYIYNSITHNPDQKLPQLIADRITLNTENNFVPVKAYESYLLTEH